MRGRALSVQTNISLNLKRRRVLKFLIRFSLLYHTLKFDRKIDTLIRPDFGNGLQNPRTREKN